METPECSQYTCFENNKHVLNIKVERFKEDEILHLSASKGDDLASVIGDRLCNESTVLVNISLTRARGDFIERLFPDTDSYQAPGEFFKFLQRHRREDTPITYEYRLGAFYVEERENLRTPEEFAFFRGIGHVLLCWLLSQIDASGESIFALEADGSNSTDPEIRAAEQKSLVGYYEKIGFKICAREVGHPRFHNSAVCMYGKFSDIRQKCNISRFDIKQESVFDGF